MSDIISHMSSIPEDRWEKAFGRKKKDNGEKAQTEKELLIVTPYVFSPYTTSNTPDTQEC